MQVDKVTRLLSALEYSGRTQEKQTAIDVAESSKGDGSAVKIADDFGSTGDVDAHRAKVAELKKQVESGTYNPDPTKVAQAVARELFA